MKAVIKQVVAASKVGNIRVPNQPMYKRFSVLVIQLANFSHTASGDLSFLIMSEGEREAAFNLTSEVVSVFEKSTGAKAREELERFANVEDFAAMGAVKASEPEARSATTMEKENFILSL